MPTYLSSFHYIVNGFGHCLDFSLILCHTNRVSRFSIGFSYVSKQDCFAVVPRERGRPTSQLEISKVFSMAKKLYVGGLPYSTTDERLREVFAQAGTVSSATIIMDRMSGRSKGFGFVEFENDDEAMKAIEMWNGKELDGRTLTVNEARPLEARPPRRQGGGGYNSRYGSGGGNGGNRGGGYGGQQQDSTSW